MKTFEKLLFIFKLSKNLFESRMGIALNLNKAFLEYRAIFLSTKQLQSKSFKI